MVSPSRLFHRFFLLSFQSIQERFKWRKYFFIESGPRWVTEFKMFHSESDSIYSTNSPLIPRLWSWTPNSPSPFAQHWLHRNGNENNSYGWKCTKCVFGFLLILLCWYRARKHENLLCGHSFSFEFPRLKHSAKYLNSLVRLA